MIPKILYHPRKVGVICLCVILLFMIGAKFGVFNFMHPVKAVTTGTITLYAINDTSTYSDAPGSQFWYNAPYLAVSYDSSTGYDHRSWFKFNLSTAYIGAINITSAKLQLYCTELRYSDPSSPIFNIRSIDPTNESWIDTTITWTNMPTRYAWYETDNPTVVNAQNSWFTWIMSDPGNSTKGMGAVQDAYDNRRTKTYVVQSSCNVWQPWFFSEDWTEFKPQLILAYSQEYGGESDATEGQPSLNNPITYDLLFYPDADIRVNPLSWSYTENVSQTRHSIDDSYDNFLYLKFDLSHPDLVDGIPNQGSFTLANVSFVAYNIRFSQFCWYAPPIDSGWIGYNTVSGIPRSNETWDQTTMDWTTKPSWRSMNTTAYDYIAIYGYYHTYPITDEQDYIRYSINHGYNYTVVHHVDLDKSDHAYSNWVMVDSSYPQYRPYLFMSVAMSNQTNIQPSLTISNAPWYLAQNWMITEFQAGLILSAGLFFAVAIPIAYITKNKYIILITIFGLLGMETMFNWLSIGLYLIVAVVLILIVGGVLGKWK
jgi:hypothetical protein